MPDITPVSPSISGVNPAPAAATAGDAIINQRGNALLRVNNGGGASINVTLAAGSNPVRPADGNFPAMTLTNQVVAVPAGASRLIGPIPPSFNDGNGKVQLAYSATASVTVEAYQPA